MVLSREPRAIRGRKDGSYVEREMSTMALGQSWQFIDSVGQVIVDCIGGHELVGSYRQSLADRRFDAQGNLWGCYRAGGYALCFLPPV